MDTMTAAMGWRRNPYLNVRDTVPMLLFRLVLDDVIYNIVLTP